MKEDKLDAKTSQGFSWSQVNKMRIATISFMVEKYLAKHPTSAPFIDMLYLCQSIDAAEEEIRRLSAILKELGVISILPNFEEKKDE